MGRPHKVTVAEVKPTGWSVQAASITADKTQIKWLEVQVGGIGWRVRRKHVVGGGWEIV